MINQIHLFSISKTITCDEWNLCENSHRRCLTNLTYMNARYSSTFLPDFDHAIDHCCK